MSTNSERSGGGIDYVRTIAETAKILGLGEPSLRVMIREGRGPTVTRLSPRRLGIRDSARNAWLDSQQRTAQPA
jgi:predicted DNA-binding transcriptional regulator AlpA